MVPGNHEYYMQMSIEQNNSLYSDPLEVVIVEGEEGVKVNLLLLKHINVLLQVQLPKESSQLLIHGYLRL